jgi:hypothetical protein
VTDPWAGPEATTDPPALLEREYGEAQEWARQRYASHVEPAGPLTAGLTSREAAELSARLADGLDALWDTRPGIEEWQTAEADSYAGTLSELRGTVADVEAEAIVSGSRKPWESIDRFRQRVTDDAEPELEAEL